MDSPFDDYVSTDTAVLYDNPQPVRREPATSDWMMHSWSPA